VLQLPLTLFHQMVGHAYDGLPDEACGLLAARPGSAQLARFYPTPNADASSRTYSIDGRDILRTERAAEGEGLEIVGVMHSHTHTEAYPSPTDVERAALLGDWHFVIVSLRDPEPVLRSWRIREGEVTEERIALLGR
jgi:[CysO sulfur-carrier protein]-S-L-cysteine hydrolase